MNELTIKDAEDLFGKIGTYDLHRFSNGENKVIRCEVEVLGIDKNSNLIVQIINSLPFKVKRPSIKVEARDFLNSLNNKVILK